MKSGDAEININDSKIDTKGKVAAGTPTVVSTSKGTTIVKGGWKKGVSIFDFLLRIVAIGAATATMGTTDQTLPFVTQFFRFKATYDDLPAFTYVFSPLALLHVHRVSYITLAFKPATLRKKKTNYMFSIHQMCLNLLVPSMFFVVANAIVAGYLVFSLPFSIISIIRPQLAGVRLLLLIFDTMMLSLSSAAAGAATAIVYLAHTGNSTANWITICQQFNDFCKRTSGAVVASFVGALLMSALAIQKH